MSGMTWLDSHPSKEDTGKNATDIVHDNCSSKFNIMSSNCIIP